MLGCIQPMSSPMMKRMFGCCWAPAGPAAHASQSAIPAQVLVSLCMASSSERVRAIPVRRRGHCNGWANLPRDREQPRGWEAASSDGAGEEAGEMSRAVARFRERGSGGRRRQRPRDAELLEARAQRAGAQSQDLGGVAGAGDPPATALEHAEEVRAFHLVEALRWPGGRPDRSAECIEAELLPVREDERAL